jgi:hypothetical protein
MPQAQKTSAAATLAAERRFPMKSGGSDRGVVLEPGGAPAGTSAETNRSAAIAGRGGCGADQGADRRIADLRVPRVHAILKRQALAAGLQPDNHKRVYRVMKVYRLLLDCHVAVSSGGMTAALRSMSAIGAGIPMASRSAATMARGCGLPSRSIAVTGKP